MQELFSSTAYPHVNTMLRDLLTRLRSILGEKLIGMYLYGSLVTGDYDDALSDVDLMVALRGDFTDEEFAAIEAMHKEIATENPRWDDRLEVAYITLHALRTFKTERSTIGIISPGEPFHYKEAGLDWLINWYNVRESGVTLYGPLPATLIEPISKQEFLQAVKDQLIEWRDWIGQTSHHHGSQAYAILTMCRCLYAVRHGEQVSKNQAAAWAIHELPQWATLINNALYWRQKMHEYGTIPEPPFEETVRFVHYIVDLVRPHGLS
jgi:predicted nucleotidyltransferase